jgi:SRSO17 transposase
LTEHKRKVKELEQARLRLILQVLKEREFTLIIDETGDRKKGKATGTCQKTVYWEFREN